MSLAVLVDVNLSPGWVPFLAGHGHTAVHWSAVGSPAALDPEIMDWARANGHVVLTNDLDFGTLLAVTHASGPSVILIRSGSLSPRSPPHSSNTRPTSGPGRS